MEQTEMSKRTVAVEPLVVVTNYKTVSYVDTCCVVPFGTTRIIGSFSLFGTAFI